jgi:hypothetical protein
MEIWDKDAIDLVETGFINITGNTGELHFICVDGDMQIKKKGKDTYSFTWNGNNEYDPASGYGEFTCKGDTLTGRIYIYDSDDSSFVAVKQQEVFKLGKMINRGMLVVKAKEPFKEWVSNLFPSEKITFKDINDDSTAYLVQEYEDDRQRDRILKKHYEDIFVEQLFDWCTDDTKWPQKRTLTMFKKWFELEFHSVVEDLVKGDVEKEDY